MADVKTEKEENKLKNVTLEEALDVTEVGWFTVLMLMFCGLSMLGTVLETMGFGYVLPGAQCTLSIPQNLYTWLAAVPFSGYILTSHAWGWAADKLGRRRAMTLSLSFGSFLSLLSSMAFNLELFITLRIAASLFIGGAVSLGYAFLGEMCPRSSRVKVITLGNSSMAAGIGVVPLIAWGVLPLDFTVSFLSLVYRPWRLLAAIFAAPHILCALACIWVPESPKYLSCVGKDEEAIEVLKTMYALNTGKPRDTYPVVSLKSEMEENAIEMSALANVWHQTVRLFKPPLLKYTFTISFVNFVIFGTSNAFYIWLPQVVTKVLGYADQHLVSNSSEAVDASFCSLLTIVTDRASNVDIEMPCNDTLRTEAFTIAIYLSIAVFFITVLSAFTAQYIGKRNLTLVFISIVGASSVATLLITDPELAVAAYTGLQLGGSIIAFTGAFTVQIYPTEIRAMSVCLTMMIGRLGSLLYTKVIGVMLTTSCPSAFISTVVMMALIFASVLILPKDDLQCCSKPQKKIDEERQN